VPSALAALLGLVITSTIVRRLMASDGEREPEIYWALGLGAMTPAWVLAFQGLLEPGAAVEGRLKLFFMAAVGVGLAGVITTDLLVRRLRATGLRPSPLALWLLGVVAFLPTWVLTLFGQRWFK
jgi:hypothetical protein